MASATKQTKVRRRLRKKKAGKGTRKERAKQGTPKFAIHPKADKGA